MITVISDLMDQLVAFSCRLLGTKRTFTCYCKLIVMKSKTLIMNFKGMMILRLFRFMYKI